jgi:hypothetical protein
VSKSNKKATQKKPAAKGAGRPAKPVEQVRSNTLRIRLTEAERQAIDGAAEGESLETSSWARAVLLREARRLQSSDDK